MSNGKNKNEEQSNLPELRNDFRAVITRLVEAAAPTEQVSACVDALAQHVGRLGVGGINTGWAQRAFQIAKEAGRLPEACIDWWDEIVCEIRYPVACCHVVTGTLPGDFFSATIATISVYDRDGKPLAHDVVEWADFASSDLPDEQSYGGFNEAIRKAAVRLGAQSLFEFFNGILTNSASIAHDSEQGEIWFDMRSYRRREQGAGDGSKHDDQIQANTAPQESEPTPIPSRVSERDFFGDLKRMRATETDHA